MHKWKRTEMMHVGRQKVPCFTLSLAESKFLTGGSIASHQSSVILTYDDMANEKQAATQP